MSYLMIEMLIVATALILFVVSFCGFLQKWRLYVQELNEENARNANDEKAKSADELPPSYNCTVEIDLPPKYDEAVKMPQLNNDLVLQVQNLPQVQVVITGEAMKTPQENVQIV